MKNEEGTSMGHQPKLRNMKMEYMEEDGGCHLQRRPKFRGNITADPHIYKNVIMGCGITKMPL